MWAQHAADTEPNLLRLRKAVEASGEVIFMTDRQGIITYVNPAFVRLYGYSPAEIIGRTTPRILKGGMTPPEAYTAFWQALLNQQVVSGVIMNRTKDGRRIEVESSANPIVDDDGNTVGFLAVQRDVTERTRANEEIKRRNRELSVLYAVSRAVVQSLNLDERLNRAIVAITSALEVDGGGIYLLAPNGRTLVLRSHVGLSESFVREVQHLPVGEGATGRAVAERRPVVMDFESYLPSRAAAIRAEGLKSIASAPIASADRVLGGLVIGTRRHRTFEPEELELLMAVGEQLGVAIRNAELYTEATQQRVLLQQIINDSPVGIALLRAPGWVYELVNPAFENFAPAKRMLGRTYAEVWPEIAGQVLPVLEEVTRSAKPKTFVDAPLEIRRAADGALEKTYFTVTYAPLALSGSSDKGVLVLAMETTERKRLEQQFLQAQKMETIGRLAGGIAHDFNNLLTAIVGYGEIVADGLGPGHSLRPDIEEIRLAADSATGLTRQLLAFSRRQILAPVVGDLNDIVGRSEKLLRRVIGEEIELLLRLDPHPSLVKLDPSQIEQVIMNLVVNARDAMSQGGRITIETSTVDLDATSVFRHPEVVPGRYVRLALSDDGVGMTPEVQAQIFEPFFTTKAPGQGTGLGLSTVYGIVKQSSGYIWVYSEPGHGTTFHLYFPIVESTTERVEIEGQQSGPPEGTETVLVVEDQASLREIARRALQRRGFHVLVAADAERAIQMSCSYEGPIHLLLTDVVMPGMGGKALADSLAVSRPDMSVLYMSGYTQDAIVHHGVLDSGIAFLSKPFTADGLVRKVRQLLDGPFPHRRLER